jgi:hypothetical protein
MIGTGSNGRTREASSDGEEVTGRRGEPIARLAAMAADQSRSHAGLGDDPGVDARPIAA